MGHSDMKLPASLFLYGTKPIVTGTLADCVNHYKTKMSELGQILCCVRVKSHARGFWLYHRDLRDLELSENLARPI